MELILVRHGHRDVPLQSHTGNPPLSARGIQHALHVATALKVEPIERIVSSGMRRADATAEPLADALGLVVETHADLGEIDRWGGEYANVETIRQKGPEELQRFRDAPIAYFGIDADRFRRETLAAFRSILHDNTGAKTAIFTHGISRRTRCRSPRHARSCASSHCRSKTERRANLSRRLRVCSFTI